MRFALVAGMFVALQCPTWAHAGNYEPVESKIQGGYVLKTQGAEDKTGKGCQLFLTPMTSGQTLKYIQTEEWLLRWAGNDQPEKRTIRFESDAKVELISATASAPGRSTARVMVKSGDDTQEVTFSLIATAKDGKLEYRTEKFGDGTIPLSYDVEVEGRNPIVKVTHSVEVALPTLDFGVMTLALGFKPGKPQDVLAPEKPKGQVRIQWSDPPLKGRSVFSTLTGYQVGRDPMQLRSASMFESAGWRWQTVARFKQDKNEETTLLREYYNPTPRDLQGTPQFLEEEFYYQVPVRAEDGWAVLELLMRARPKKAGAKYQTVARSARRRIWIDKR